MGVINRAVRNRVKRNKPTKQQLEWQPRYKVDGTIYKADEKKAKELGFPLSI